MGDHSPPTKKLKMKPCPMGNPLWTVFGQFFKTKLNSYRIVGLMRKEIIPKSKLWKLRKAEILIKNFRKNHGATKKFITWSELNLLDSAFCKQKNCVNFKNLMINF